MVEAIRLKLVPPRAPNDSGDIRRTFWTAMGHNPETSSDISKLEGKICRDLARGLRNDLIDEIAAPIRKIERSAFDGQFFDFERFMFRDFDRKGREYDGDRSQIFDALLRHMDERQKLFQSNPEIRRIQDKVAKAGGVYFSVKLAGYASLNLDVSVSGIAALADVFDRDFESFRVFLEAFIPQALYRALPSDNVDLLEISTSIPPSFEAAFAVAAAMPLMGQVPANLIASAAPQSASREKAEWLWRLANGSLLVPLVIALVVMYCGMSMLIDIRGTQFDALKPVLDHQLKLLEEDRHRLNDAKTTAPESKK